MSFDWQTNHCSNSTAPRALSFSTAAASLGLSVVAAPWNFLICLTIYKDPHKNLRTPFNILILNVAIADLIQGFAVLPLSAAYHVLEGYGQVSVPLRRALHLFFFISCTSSIVSIAALAVDRCISISYPLKYRSKSTYSRSVRISIVIWLISVGLSFLYLHVDFITYTFVFVNCVILLTVVVLVVVQYWVNRSLRNHRESKEFRPPSQTNRNYVTFCNHWDKMVKRHARVTRTFLAILMAFLFLNAPSFIFAYVLNFCKICDCDSIHIFRDLHFLFDLFPSTVNPFLFGWRLPHFKRALTKIISRKTRNNELSALQVNSSTFRPEDGPSNLHDKQSPVKIDSTLEVRRPDLTTGNLQIRRNTLANSNIELRICNNEFQDGNKQTDLQLSALSPTVVKEDDNITNAIVGLSSS